MKTFEYFSISMEYFKNREFPEVEGRGMSDEPISQPHGEVSGKSLEKDPATQERERQLEAWMTDIKSFIRSIDISKL